jgi:uncharacterized protein YkwD
MLRIANHRRTLARTCIALTATVAAVGTTAHTASAADTAGCPGALDQPSAATLDQAGDTVVCLVNAERADRGLPPLRGDADLGQAAARQAGDMVRRQYFAHVTPGGADLGDRLRSAGYGDGSGWRAGEALGWGTGSRATPAALVDEWIASAPHRRILLDPGFRELGVGIAAGAPVTTDGRLTAATYALEAAVLHG